METERDMQSDSIACSHAARWEKFTIALVLDRTARFYCAWVVVCGD
jgi:hypothetical protein